MKGLSLPDLKVSPPKLKHYKAYLFDMDGTLVNSEPLKGEALALACQHYGERPDYHIYQDVMGQDWPSVTQHFFNTVNINPPLTEFNLHFKKYYQILLKNQLNLTKGAKPYLKQLKESGYKIGIVSSAASWMLKQILEQLALENIFDIVITQDDVRQHKPHPEAYLLALKKLTLNPANVLIFEDSNAGITAATDAGCDVIAIRHELNIKNDLSAAKTCLPDFSPLLE